MANAIFTTQANPSYDDVPELRYHFPRRYLKIAEQTVGDLIIYYEPRRESLGATSSGGRQAYFATARVDRIERDPSRANHYYAFIKDFVPFTNPVPFKAGETYYESRLQKEDGTTNRGLFGWNLRLISGTEYQIICQAGLSDAVEIAREESGLILAETPIEYGRSDRVQVVKRPVRDAAFARVVQKAYESTCAMTGLRLINGSGRCEIEAAHIWPVEEDGPDSPRNGIALSRTVHWMFDRGWLSVSDFGDILVADKLVPDTVKRMLNPDRKMRMPSTPAWSPHPLFLRHHRSKFKGD
jgi:putative restriction endonuclease